MRVRIRGVCIDQRRSSIVSVRSSSVLSRTAPFYLIYFLFHTIGIPDGKTIEFEKRTRERRVSTAGFAFGPVGALECAWGCVRGVPATRGTGQHPGLAETSVHVRVAGAAHSLAWKTSDSATETANTKSRRSVVVARI